MQKGYCKHCGTTLRTDDKRVKFCSPECRFEYRATYLKQHDLTRKHKVRSAKEHTCLYCGHVWIAMPTRPALRFCCLRHERLYEELQFIRKAELERLGLKTTTSQGRSRKLKPLKGIKPEEWEAVMAERAAKAAFDAAFVGPKKPRGRPRTVFREPEPKRPRGRPRREDEVTHPDDPRRKVTQSQLADFRRTFFGPPRPPSSLLRARAKTQP